MKSVFLSTVVMLCLLFSSAGAADPVNAGDPDCSGANDVSDLTYIVDFLFAGGQEPCDIPFVEAGISFAATGDPNSLMPLTGSGQSFTSVSINSPEAGWILVNAKAKAFMSHTPRSNEQCYL